MRSHLGQPPQTGQNARDPFVLEPLTKDVSLRRRTVLSAFGVVAACLCAAGAARADDSIAAQALFDQGKEAMAAKDYTRACPKFAESLRLEPALGTLLNLADCYEREGKLASAWSAFREVASKARVAGQTERARIGKERAAALAPRLSALVVSVPADSRMEGLVIRRDGTIVGEAEWDSPIPVDSGGHSVEASCPGHKTWSQTVNVNEAAQTMTVAVPVLEPLPAETPAVPFVPATPPPAPVSATPAPSPIIHRSDAGPRPVTLIVGAVGIAGLATGGLFGLLSLIKHNQASQDCPAPGPCTTQSGFDERNAAHDFGNVSTVAIAAGGALIAASAVLWFTWPRASSEEGGPSVAIAPTGFQLTETW